MSNAGILDVSLVKGTTNGETFSRFVLSNLLPHLQPFNGTNPHSVVVMDNCSIHHVQEVEEIFDEAGVLLLFLPPYSPDLNPIELAFSKVKSQIKNLEPSMGTFDTETMILAAFASISNEDCQHWISHCFTITSSIQS